MPKFKLPIFPFLFAVYPLFALLGRNPGELPPVLALRFTIVLSALAILTISLFRLATRDLTRSTLLGTFLLWSLSSSGHVYRLLEGYLPGGTDAWLHPALIISFILMTIFLAQSQVWARLRPEKWSADVTSYLNLTSALMLMFAVWPVAQFWLTAYDDQPQPWREAVSTDDVTLSTPDAPPDIYYIVLDGYGRQDILDEIYGYDNSGFLDFLRGRGFYVAASARSNYGQTPLSLAASLNFDFINFATDYAGRRSVDRIPLLDLVQESRVRRLLESAGYRIVATSSGYPFTELRDADHYRSPYLDTLNELERFYLSTTALDLMVSSDSDTSRFLRHYLPLPGYETSRQRILYSLDRLREIPKMEGPKFVFVHIVGPHPPFVLDHQGNAVTPDRPYVPGDGEAFGGDSLEYQQQYVEQLIYINAQMELAVDAILEKSGRPPIILIQGDHGPGSLLVRDSLERTCLRERTSILSAYYFPDGLTGGLYPEITPVNSFRAVFNAFFATNLALKEDLSFFSPQSWPYDFTDVTDQIEASCSE